MIGYGGAMGGGMVIGYIVFRKIQQLFLLFSYFCCFNLLEFL